jgi:hypothetical protein
MRKLLIIMLMLSLNVKAQYTNDMTLLDVDTEEKVKHKKKIKQNSIFITGGLLLASAGTLGMLLRGDTPFINNGTMWVITPSELAICTGAVFITIGIVFKI